MKKKNVTKGALLASILAMVLCITMLVGTTFAWFTDTASANVNKIQSGTLDVGLQMKDADGNWVDAENKTLSWVQAKGENETQLVDGKELLWEPGCTFQLQPIRVVNNGNLALKYKIAITGIDGDAKLNKVITWTVNGVGTEEFTTLMPKGEKGDSQEITIAGTMDTSAGNDYQNLTIDNIAITVYATQVEHEFDSNGNNYDAGADFTPDNLDKTVTANVTADVKAGENTILKNSDTDATVVATVPAGAVDESVTKLTLSVVPTTKPENITIETGTDAFSCEVTLKDQDGNEVKVVDGQSVKVEIQLGKNLNVIDFLHNGVSMTKAASADAVTLDHYYYDAATGVVTFVTDDFSPFTAVTSDSVFNGGNGTEAAPYLIATGEQAYQMRDAKGYFKLVNDVVVTNEVYLSGKTVVVDLNGHSIKLEYADDVKPNNGGVFNISGQKSSLTINDSSAAQTGAVIGSNKTYANKVTSAVRVGNYGKLTINGGHFYGTSEATSCIFVMTSRSSGSKATVTINGGKFETASALNGTYYVLNHQDSATTGCTITVNGGSFKNYNPGVTVVEPTNAYTGKVVLGTGCTTTSAEVDGATWYTVSK